MKREDVKRDGVGRGLPAGCPRYGNRDNALPASRPSTFDLQPAHSPIRVHPRSSASNSFLPIREPRGQIGGLLSPWLESLRMAAVARWLQGPLVLDVGCGRGRLARAVGPGMRYLGGDHDLAILRLAHRRFPAAGFLCLDMRRPPPLALAANSLVMAAVLEHVDAPAEFVRAWSACLAPGGRLIVTTPPGWSDRVLALGGRLGIFDRGAHAEHQQYLDRRRLCETFRLAGLEPLHYERFAFGANQLAVARRPA